MKRRLPTLWQPRIPHSSHSPPGIEVSRAEWDASDSNYNGAFEWSDPVNVTDSLLGDTYQMVQDPSVAVGPGGDVYVAFNLFAGPPGDAMGAPTAIGIVGGDGTGTWATAWDEEDVAIVDGGFRRGSAQPRYWSGVHSYPVLAVDHSDGDQRGRVYLTWVSDDNGGDVKVVSALPGSGETPTWIPESVVGTTRIAVPALGDVRSGGWSPVGGSLRLQRRSEQRGCRFRTLGQPRWGFDLDDVASQRRLTEFEYDDLNLDSSGYFWGHYTGLAALDGQVVAMWMGPVAGDVGVWGESRHFTDFVNRSDDTSFDFTATPYASVPFDYDGDGDVDLYLTNPGGTAGLMENLSLTGAPDVRQFTNRQEEFADGESRTLPWRRGRGLRQRRRSGTVRRGDEPSPVQEHRGVRRVLRGYQRLARPVRTTTSSWMGAWGDYDRDGWIDLYIARAGTVSDAPSGALRDRLLRNMEGEWLKNVSSDVGLSSVTYTTSTGAAWADADGDGNLDIFVSAAGSGESSRLFMQSIAKNQTTYEYEHTFADSSSAVPASLDNIAGASWRDLNNNGHLDLLLSGTGTGADGSRILWNDGEGDLTSTDLIDGGFASKGHELLDGDLDGAADIVLAPASTSKAPGYFRNNHDDTEPSFSNYWRLAGVDTDASYTMTAISAVDLAGAANTPDGDEDLYIGRASSSGAFFYQNTQGGTDTPSNKWLKVKLDPGTRLNNAACIGTKVKAQTTLPGSEVLVQTQIVDGGRGVGGQGTPELTFGLRDTTNDVTLTVTWPDGSEQNETVLYSGLEPRSPSRTSTPRSWTRLPSGRGARRRIPGGGVDLRVGNRWLAIRPWTRSDIESGHGQAPAQPWMKISPRPIWMSKSRSSLPGRLPAPADLGGPGLQPQCNYDYPVASEVTRRRYPDISWRPSPSLLRELGRGHAMNALVRKLLVGIAACLVAPHLPPQIWKSMESVYPSARAQLHRGGAADHSRLGDRRCELVPQRFEGRVPIAPAHGGGREHPARPVAGRACARRGHG